MKKFTLIPLLTMLAMGLPLAGVLAASYNTSTFMSKIDDGAGEVATKAYVDEPMGMDMNGQEDIFFVDTANNAVEKINKETDKLTRVAGTGEFGNVDGAANQAQFAMPYDLTVMGEEGNTIFVADTFNNAIRKIAADQVSTLIKGLNQPKGITQFKGQLYISDTGNNRILSANRKTGANVAIADSGDGLNLPTKLTYCRAVDRLVFVNSGEGAVRALDIATGNVSNPLIDGLEDVGGIYCEGRSLYVASSYSIGVFNEIWLVRLNNKGTGTISKKRISHVRETEHLNWPSDIVQRTDTVRWEEYYTWAPNLLYFEDERDTVMVAKKTKTSHLKKASHKKKYSQTEEMQCLNIRKPGETAWRDQWLVDIDKKSEWQTANFILKNEYQGDQPFFRVKLVYDDKDLPAEDRADLREENQSAAWFKGGLIASKKIKSTTLSAPLNLTTLARGARTATLGWDAVDGATKYDLHLFQGDQRLFSRKDLTAAQVDVKKNYLKSNQVYQFRVRACAAGACSDWSEFYELRTLPAVVQEIAQINPKRATRMTMLANGDFLATLRYRLPASTKDYRRENLRALVQLCSKNTDHPAKISAERLYVLYKGGSAVLAWRKNGTLPQHYAGKHRFQDDYGKKENALVGRPKAIAFSSDGTKMYISQNNQFAIYDFSTSTLKHLAGHLMDSYLEGTGREVRVSDVTDMVISPDDKWLYFVDRNNHRIRKINTKTGTTKYITGAGGTNFSFGSIEGNGYQEGKACENETAQNKKGCAYFNRPTGIAISPNGKTLYIAEGSNNRVRGVDAATGDTWLIAGSGDAGFKDGAGAAAQFNGPYTLDISTDGSTLYVADKTNNAVRKIDLATKNVTTLFGKGTVGKRDGAFKDAVLAIPEYIREENGTLYWTEAGTQSIRAASLSAQTVFTVSGSGAKGYKDGPGSEAEWLNPKGFDFRGGKMYVADYANDLIRTVEL